MPLQLTRSDKRRLVPWMALSAFALGLASFLAPLDETGSRLFVALNIALLVQGLVWFTYLHWHSKDPGGFEFLENLLLAPAVGLLPALLGVWLMKVLGLVPG